MPETVLGLPLHPLVVHATVFTVPLAALAVALYAVWPRFRRWAGWGPLALSIAAIVLVPISTSSGENLEHQMGGGSLIEQHSELADMMIWWVIPLGLVAAGLYWLHGFRGGRMSPRTGRAMTAALVAVPVLLAAGTLVQVALVGHSGAEAAWSDVAK